MRARRTQEVQVPAVQAVAAVTQHTISPLAVSVEGAAEAIGISKGEAYNRIRSGELPIVKLGKRTLIRVSDLEAFLAARAGATLSRTPMMRASAAKKTVGEAPKEVRHAAAQTTS